VNVSINKFRLLVVPSWPVAYFDKYQAVIT